MRRTKNAKFPSLCSGKLFFYMLKLPISVAEMPNLSPFLQKRKKKEAHPESSTTVPVMSVCLFVLTCVSDERVPGEPAVLARDGDARAVVVAEELLHLVSGDLDPGLSVPDAGLRFHVVLDGGIREDERVALEVHRERVRHAAAEGGGSTLRRKSMLLTQTNVCA